jgi:hypothetical protein
MTVTEIKKSNLSQKVYCSGLGEQALGELLDWRASKPTNWPM